jgi:hypothetical protein
MRSGTLIAAVLALTACGAAAGGWFVDVEAGGAFPGYNDVQVPNDSTGTRFSLTEVLDVPPVPVFRARVGYSTGRHAFSAFAAPLRLEGDGTLAADVRFRGTVFPEGTDVEGLYRFDSYRLTWRYLVHESSCLAFSAGLTAKIRDAEIRLSGGGITESETNMGFVPLVSFSLAWSPCGVWGLLLDGDALVGPVGRAEDVFLGGTFRADDRLLLRLGYRIVEGGADVESVYNFTLVNFLMAGATLGI